VISIGVRLGARGREVGEKLLRALIAEAGWRGLGLCLSVHSENPARRLCERLGFRIVEGSAVRNRRTGGISLEMIRECG
jgi:ribosomal protein S18 acetylase RimI-like enzyme